MRAKVLHECAGARKYALSFERGDEIIALLSQFARDYQVHHASFSGLGTLGGAVLAWFDESKRQYAPIPVDETVELLMLDGRISAPQGRPDVDVNAHVVIGKLDGTAHGGHLLRATVQPQAHLFVEETRPRIPGKSPFLSKVGQQQIGVC